MVVFLYLSWFSLMQFEIYVNTGEIFLLDIYTTGTPLAVAVFFYWLKHMALFIRNQIEMDKLRKEENESR